MYSERLKKLIPYTPGEQPQNRKYIKLNTNENPFPPTSKINDYLKSVDISRLQLYPDPSAFKLREAIGNYYSVPASNIFVGNGSDEILSLCFSAFFNNNEGPVLFPEYTYSFYPVYCSYYSLDYIKVPVNKDFSLSVDLFLTSPAYTGIIFPNPNAPTGILLEQQEILKLMDSVRKDVVVIIDEAYIDFGGTSSVPLIQKFDNLLIVQTFSKSRALAGSRIGFAVGNKNLIEALTTVKDSFNSYPLDFISQKLGEISVSDTAYFRDITERIIKNREYTSFEFKRLGWEVLPSQANFIFTRKKGIAGKDIYAALKEKGILVRHFDQAGIEDFVRITIGKRDDIEFLLDCAKDLK